MPKLEVSLPDGTQVSHELIDGNITLGRLSDNMIQIEDASVSSHHGEFVLENGAYRLRDLGSTNGTFVNGEAVVDVVLGNSDAVRFGQIDCVYITEASTSTRPLPEQAAAPVAVAASSERPRGFANASPFKASKKKKSPIVVGIYSFVGLAVAMFVGAVVLILRLTPP